MPVSSQQGSARIYAFVPRQRAGRPVRRDRDASVTELAPRVAVCEYGSGSYHDAAIEEERQRRP